MSERVTPGRLLFRVDESAEGLRLGLTTVKALSASGGLRFVKVRGARRVSARVLADYLARIERRRTSL